MSRLIDADALIESFRKCYSGHLEMENSDRMMTFRSMCRIINNQQTAYDTDKVVEQLEELGQKMSESKSIQKYGKSSPANHRYYKAVSVKRAIEIVKDGGVN